MAKGDTVACAANSSVWKDPVKVWPIASGWKVRMAGWFVTAVSTPFTRRTGGSTITVKGWAVKSKSPSLAVMLQR